MPSQSTIATTGSLRKRPRKSVPTRFSATTQPLSLKRYLGLRGTPQGVYEIVRTTNGSVRVTAATGFDNGVVASESIAFTFSMQNIRMYAANGTVLLNTFPIPNAAEISALWDDIKIDKVEVTISGYTAPSNTPLTTTGYVVGNQFLFGTDDNDSLSSLATVQQLGDCKSMYMVSNSGSNQRTITVRPKYQQIIYYTSLSSGYAPKSGYIRSDYDIEHYALKIARVPMNNTADNANGQFNFSFKIFLKCKSLK